MDASFTGVEHVTALVDLSLKDANNSDVAVTVPGTNGSIEAVGNDSLIFAASTVNPMPIQTSTTTNDDVTLTPDDSNDGVTSKPENSNDDVTSSRKIVTTM